MKLRVILTIWILVLTGRVFAQNYAHRAYIDSLSQQQWQKQAIDLDSLNSVALQPLKTIVVDTIMPPLIEPLVEKKDAMPVTPYHFLKKYPQKQWLVWGQNDLVFNQASFSNWNAGGNNNIGIIGRINYNITYKKNSHYWENVIKIGYGFVSAQGQASRKTEDYLSITSNYGYDIGKNYYLSTGVQLLTQFTPGYNYTLTPEPSYKDRISKLMAPGYINAGVGISYNPNENLQVVFRPANAKLTLVLDEALQQAGKYGLERDGQSLRAELGAMLNILYRINIIKDVQFINQLGFFTNYLQHIERVDLHYNGSIHMKLNKFISTTINVNVVYDHDQIQKVQMKQTLGVGFSYNFGLDEKKKIKKKNKLTPFVLKTN